MKLKLEIDAPPNEHDLFYPGMILSGKLYAKSTKVHKDYESITVTLMSQVHVGVDLTKETTTTNNPHEYKTIVPDNESAFSDDSLYDTSSETVMRNSITLWQRAFVGDHFPPGNFVYHFKFTLDESSLPSYGDGRGRITHKIIGDILNEKKEVKKSAKKHFTFMNIVDANEPHLMQPAMMEVSRVLRSILWFIPGGSFNMKVTIPRTGYSPNDVIPVAVFIDNGSGREIRQVVATLLRTTMYKTKGNYTHQCHCHVSTTISNPVPAHTTANWEPPPLPVPDMISTVTGGKLTIIEIKYTIRVTAFISWAYKDIMIDIPIVIGNVQPASIATNE
ncbi:PREDICTED: arrestin domain-containing protein 2-like [Amphimedon queenslandica]|uniref:Arrestin C-terminal-like domain-containing protein n=1 Tax=Amphimedon queenslandica TaxID=400682 RepID=A0A1X7UG50_AMPQE|nr:PREDICTED: arrestin domain-containing protein 2-like [Amphimedon queenslandica]|eukprot:XP_011405279.1 PREDICTED: arrestin domain-containing protein 2-like [Amphimedon queenslandica]